MNKGTSKKRIISSNLKILGDIFKTNKLTVLFIAIVAVICIIAFQYFDGQAYTVWTVEMWDAIFSGKAINIQQIIAENARLSPAVQNSQTIDGSALLTLVPWMIWNLPLWLTHSLKGNSNVLTFGCLAWSQLYVYLFALANGLICYHIVEYLSGNKEHGKLAFLFFCGSGTLAISVGYSMQDEVVYIFAFLLAVYFCLRGQRKLTLLCLVISVTQCPIMIVPALILLLTMEKNIFMILGKSALCLFPYWLAGKLLPGKGWGFNLIDWFFGRCLVDTGFSYDTQFSRASVFAIIMVAIYIYAYFYVDKSRHDYNKSLLNLLTLTVSAMCIFCWMHFYRWILCIPFMLIGILTVPEKGKGRIKLGLLLVVCLEALRLVASPIYDNNCLGARYLAPLFQSHLYADFEISQILDAIFFQCKGVFPVISGAIVSIAILINWVIMSKNDKSMIMPVSERLIALINVVATFAILALYIVLPMTVMGMTSTIDGDGLITPDLNSGVIIQEKYLAQKDCKVKKVGFRFVTWNNPYSDDYLLHFRIADSENDEIKWEETRRANELIDNTIVELNPQNVKLESGHWYSFQIFTSGETSEDHHLCLVFSKQDSSRMDCHYSTVLYPASETEDIYNKDITSVIFCTI